MLAGSAAGALGWLWPVGRLRAQEQTWSEFLTQIGTEARRLGISPATTKSALADAELLDRIIELDRKQPEGRLTFAQYMASVVTQDRIERGREVLAANHDLLERIRVRYGIPIQVIVALWGVESSYGTRTGSWSVISSLATLAYEGRRSEFFRGELMAALRILDAGDVALPDLKGSWAGAMGQPQFMPTTYLAHAVDWDDDSRRDIWGSPPDIFASMSNFLAKSGWRQGQLWGRPVLAPATLKSGLRGTVAEFARVGVREADGTVLPQSELTASLLRMDGAGGPTFLTYHNFSVFKIWNRSDYFALSVGTIADQLKSG